ncbi:hypothetical protein A2U01_0067153, partial [Trifolium medium]|nr:hypothetical protein [Trifolium medium]
PREDREVAVPGPPKMGPWAVTATSFWFDHWLGGTALKIQYQSLFHQSEQRLDMVGDMGNLMDGV